MKKHTSIYVFVPRALLKDLVNPKTRPYLKCEQWTTGELSWWCAYCAGDTMDKENFPHAEYCPVLAIERILDQDTAKELAP